MSVVPISYYLVLSAILFGLGVVAFVFKRNIITIFMSIELMLNAVNLAFVAFARARGQLDGLVFVFFVIVVAAAEAAVGLAIVIVIARNRAIAQRRTRELCSSSDAHTRPSLDHSRAAARWARRSMAFSASAGRKPSSTRVAVGSVSLAFLAVAELVREFCHARAEPDSLRRKLFHLDRRRAVPRRFRAASRPAHRRHAAGGHLRRLADPHLFHRLHGARGRLLPLLLLSESVHVLHADAGAGREPHRDVRRLGRRRPVQLPADRLLVPEEVGDGRRQESLLRHAHRRLRLHRRHPAGCSATFGIAGFRRRSFQEPPRMPAETDGSIGVLTAICLLLFVGAIGKSAQIPLYVWLPDAMEGPTPVSALIHAATMVTAGVYMVARMNPLFSRAPIAMLVVAIVGALTAFFAATIGLVQTDIKKVLAYSTVSQLGYMFLACGVGAFARRHLPPDDARLLQRPALPRRRQRDPRHGRRAGHAQDGRPAQEDSRHLLDDADRHARDRRHSRLLPDSSARTKFSTPRGSGPHANLVLWLLGIVGRGPHVVLHVPPAVPDVLRRAALRRASRPRPRIAEEHDCPADDSGASFDLSAAGWPRRTSWAARSLRGVPCTPSSRRTRRNGWRRAERVADRASRRIRESGDRTVPRAHRPARDRRRCSACLLAWWFYIRKPGSCRSDSRRACTASTRCCSNKYFVDEIYAALIVRPLLWISTNVLWHVVDEGVIDGTVNGVGARRARIGRRSCASCNPAIRAATPRGSLSAPWASRCCCWRSGDALAWAHSLICSRSSRSCRC